MRQDALTVGLLVQAVADPALAGSDPDPPSVQVATVRVRLTGRLDGGFDYLVQTDFARARSILDARVGWSSSDRFRVDAGRFKTPFSRELLTYAGAIDFVNRSRVVEALAPGRQAGVQAAGAIGSRARRLLGGFSGPDDAPPGGSGIAAARVEWGPARAQDGAGSRRVWLATSAAVGRDGAVRGRAPAPSGARDGALLGVDARIEAGRLLLAAEVMAAEWRLSGGGETSASGGYATVGWSTGARTQVLARWDRYRPPGGEATDVVLLGWNVWPTSASEIQVNWLAPVGGGETPHKWLVNFQIGFRADPRTRRPSWSLRRSRPPRRTEKGVRP